MHVHFVSGPRRLDDWLPLKADLMIGTFRQADRKPKKTTHQRNSLSGSKPSSQNRKNAMEVEPDLVFVVVAAVTWQKFVHTGTGLVRNI